MNRSPEKREYLSDAALADKSSVLKYIATACARNGLVSSPEILHKGLLQREQTMSTGVGNGIGFPHTANPEAREAGVVLIRLATPIAFESLDNQPVDIVLGMIFRHPTRHSCPHAGPGLPAVPEQDFLDTIRHADNADRLLKQMKLMENGTGVH
ncbi:MAG: PTS sugar transporter subunit IIA [Desulfobacterales bacterium]